MSATKKQDNFQLQYLHLRASQSSTHKQCLTFSSMTCLRVESASTSASFSVMSFLRSQQVCCVIRLSRAYS